MAVMIPDRDATRSARVYSAPNGLLEVAVGMRRLALLLLVWSATVSGWQATAPTPPAQAPVAAAPAAVGSAKIWPGREAEIEDYLRTSPFTRVEDVPIGVTKPRRGYFAEGGLVVSAAWKVLRPGRPNGFWESYKSEIGAYEMDKLLGLNMVPPAVEKVWKGDRGAAVLWVQPVRSWKAVENLPKPDRWNLEAIRMKMFDNLIGNSDRNAGNFLVDDEWNLFLIDHSRAFVNDTKLPFTMVRIDKPLWEKMQALDEARLMERLGPWMDKASVRAILKRRDKMQQTIDKMVKTTNESVVFIR
jgi:hypothetical protein